MGRNRDPKRDIAYEIYKASNGEMRLTDIAAQLETSEGTLRGWKAKDKWENLLNGEVDHLEHSDKSEGNQRNETLDEEEQSNGPDELFIDAVQIVAEAKQASVSLLQRRLRIGYARSARLIDELERRKMIGPYKVDKPREVYVTLMTIDALIKENGTVPQIKNAPKTVMERSNNKERSKKEKSVPLIIEQPEPEIPDDEGLTQKQRIFIMEYLRDFNATRSAIAAGFSKKTAYSIGWELLRKPEIQAVIRKYNESMMDNVGMNAQRVLMEYMKMAFADITDYVDFGQKEEDVLDADGKAVINPETGKPEKYKYNFVSFRDSEEVDGTLISEVKKGKDGISVKLHDKIKALEMLTKYMDLLPDNHKRMVDAEKLKLDRERLELDKQKAAGEGDLDEELIDEWVNGVMGVEESGEHDQTDDGIQNEDAGISQES